MKDIEKLHEIYGETVSLVTPSGFKVVLRQQNGDDDDIISNAANSVDGTAINNFVRAIIVDSDISPTGTLVLGDVLNIKLCDKYFIILASRIFSLGQILKFSFKWENIPEPVDYEEDLSKYIWDYSKPEFPLKFNDPDYFEYRIQPHQYQKALTKQFTTQSGKVLKYTFINGEGEKYLLKLTPETQSKNKELIARDLQLFLNEKWIKVENFKSFSPIDMSDIRKEIDETDPSISLISQLESPVTHEKIDYPIVSTMDFFFPREI